MKHILVVGGGLVGSLQSILLAKRGFKVTVFESRPDIRTAEIAAGKSINLALSNRGFKALEKAGVKQKALDIAIPMLGRRMHAIDGSLSFQSYGKDDEAIFSIGRGELNQMLLIEADQYGVEMHFEHKCLDVDLKNKSVSFLNQQTGEKVVATADHIIGADGAFSAVRSKMMRRGRFDYSQTYLNHGYKEILLPANEDGTHKLEKNALHIWPRGQYMLIALPNLDGSYTCTLFFPYEGEPSFSSLKEGTDVEAFFKEQFPDFAALMPNIGEAYFENPVGDLVTVRCAPWNHGDASVLMGDAAHAIVPFYGQGMNAGFEDCSIFDELMEANSNDVSLVFDQFATQRKPNGDAIAELALYNYIEMRDRVGDPMFLLQKKIEKKIFEKHPDKWMPLYSQVTFSHIPYSEALSVGKKQAEIMKSIMQKEDIAERWDSEEIEMEILKSL